MLHQFWASCPLVRHSIIEQNLGMISVMHCLLRYTRGRCWCGALTEKFTTTIALIAIPFQPAFFRYGWIDTDCYLLCKLKWCSLKIHGAFLSFLLATLSLAKGG